MNTAKQIRLAAASIFLVVIGALIARECLKNDLDAEEQTVLNKFKSEKGKACASVTLFAKSQSWEIEPDSALVSRVLDVLPSRMMLQSPAQLLLPVAPNQSIHFISTEGGEITLRLYEGPMDVIVTDGGKYDSGGQKVWRIFRSKTLSARDIMQIIKERRGLDWDVSVKNKEMP